MTAHIMYAGDNEDKRANNFGIPACATRAITR